MYSTTLGGKWLLLMVSCMQRVKKWHKKYLVILSCHFASSISRCFPRGSYNGANGFRCWSREQLRFISFTAASRRWTMIDIDLSEDEDSGHSDDMMAMMGTLMMKLLIKRLRWSYTIVRCNRMSDGSQQQLQFYLCPLCPTIGIQFWYGISLFQFCICLSFNLLFISDYESD